MASAKSRPPSPERRTAFVTSVLAAAALALAALPSLPPAWATLGLERSREGPSFEIAAEAPRSPRSALLEEVAKPLERRLLSLPGVLRVESRIEDGRALFRLEAARGADPDALDLAIARRAEGLPLARLTVTPVAEREPLLELLLLGGSGARRSAFARSVLLPEIGRAAGAGRIETIGARPLRVAVTPLSAPLAARGLTALDVVARLRAVGATLPAGRVRDGAALRPLSYRERIGRLEELGALEVRGPAGATPLSEVAAFGPREIADGSWARSLAGTPEDALLVRLFPTPGAGAARLAAEVERTLARLRPSAAGAGFRLATLPSRRRPLLPGGLRFLPAALLVGALAASSLAFGFGRRRAAWVSLAAALLVALGAARLASATIGGGERVTVRFDLPGDPAAPSSLERGVALARRLTAEVSGLGPRPALLAYRRGRADLPLPSREGGEIEDEGGFYGEPDPEGERGRVDLVFPSAAGAARARSILTAALARIPDAAGRVEGGLRLSVEASAPDPLRAEALAARAGRALAERGVLRLPPVGAAPPGLRLHWDESLLAAQGVEAAALDEQVRAGLGGFAAGRVEIAGVEPEIWIEPTAGPGSSEAPEAIEALGLLPLRPAAASAVAVPLRALARIERHPEPPPLLRIDGRPAVRLTVPPSSGLDRKALAAILEGIPLARGESLKVREEGDR